MNEQRAGMLSRGEWQKTLDKKGVKEMEEGKRTGILWSDLPCFIMFVTIVDKY